MSEPRFTHQQDGTPEHVWFQHPVWDEVPAGPVDSLLTQGFQRVLVLAAHPDDETIGVGALVGSLADQGLPVTFLLATDGEKSHADSRVWSPDQVAGLRRAEWRAALRDLAPDARLVRLGLPDGELAEHASEIDAAVAEHLAPGTLLLAPWHQDGHPDHDAMGAAAARAVASFGAGTGAPPNRAEQLTCWYYPVWWWHWNTPDEAADFLASNAFIVEPGVAAVRRKHVALEAYASQLGGLGPGGEHAPVVSPQVRRRSRRAFEVLFTDGELPALTPREDPASGFDEMYDDGDDPWGWEQSWYETRRRAVLLATLLRPRYRRVLELGCGTGLLSVELAGRCDELAAVDVSTRALELARGRGLGNSTFSHGRVPDELPAGDFDLVVVSELAYFLPPAELLRLLRGIRRRLAPGGEVVLADWRHPTQDIPLDGELVHEMVDACLGLPLHSRHVDADVRVELWSERASVAGDEGLV